jgi:hypothetical protein
MTDKLVQKLKDSKKKPVSKDKYNWGNDTLIVRPAKKISVTP